MLKQKTARRQFLWLGSMFPLEYFLPLLSSDSNYSLRENSVQGAELAIAAQRVGDGWVSVDCAGRTQAGADPSLRLTQKTLGGGAHLWLADGVAAMGQGL